MFRYAILLPLLMSAVPPAALSASFTRFVQEATSGEPYELGPGIVSPTKLVTPSPIYPKEALQSGVSGSVVLSVWVEKDGRFSHVTVVRGLGHGLDEAAIMAVRRWTYSPATKDGKPVTVHALIKVRFEIAE